MNSTSFTSIRSQPPRSILLMILTEAAGLWKEVPSTLEADVGIGQSPLHEEDGRLGVVSIRCSRICKSVAARLSDGRCFVSLQRSRCQTPRWLPSGAGVIVLVLMFSVDLDPSIPLKSRVYCWNKREFKEFIHWPLMVIENYFIFKEISLV